jgi:hypothetical protein
MSISNYAEEAILNATFRNTSFAAGATITLSLHTGDPGETGTANEVSGGSYARQTISFNAASGGSIAASAAVEFSGMPAVTGSSYVTHVGLWASTNHLWSGALTTQRQVQAGDTLRISTLTVTLD